MLWGWLLAGFLYVVGSSMIFMFTMYDHDPWWQRALAVLGWPLLFPYAMIFGRD